MRRERTAGTVLLGVLGAVLLLNVVWIGGNCADAFLRMYMMEAACMIQVRAQAGGTLSPVPESILPNIPEQTRAVTFGKFGLLAWPGLLRKLDRRSRVDWEEAMADGTFSSAKKGACA